jgi:hypothetical protein
MAEARPSYLTVDEADALAADEFGLAAWADASDDDKRRALTAATGHVDSAMRYQGGRYAPDQALEFPRRPYDDAPSDAYGAEVVARPADVWDWDDEQQAAVVPLNVRRACLLQADHLLSGEAAKRKKALDKINAGIKSVTTGDLSTTYQDADKVPAADMGRSLCGEAAELLARYRLKTGRLL